MESLVNICNYRGRMAGLRVLPGWRWNVGLVGPNINSQNRINWPGSVNHTLVHKISRQHLHLLGTNGGLRVLPEWRWNVGFGGASINSQNRIHWPSNLRWKLWIISKGRRNITFLRIGDMANGPRPGGLRSSGSSCSWSPILISSPDDLRPIFYDSKMASLLELIR